MRRHPSESRRTSPQPATAHVDDFDRSIADTLTAVGIGIGVGMLVTGLVLRNVRSEPRPALALDIGPAGASVAVTFRF